MRERKDARDMKIYRSILALLGEIRLRISFKGAISPLFHTF